MEPTETETERRRRRLRHLNLHIDFLTCDRWHDYVTCLSWIGWRARQHEETKGLTAKYVLTAVRFSWDLLPPRLRQAGERAGGLGALRTQLHHMTECWWPGTHTLPIAVVYRIAYYLTGKEACALYTFKIRDCLQFFESLRKLSSVYATEAAKLRIQLKSP